MFVLGARVPAGKSAQNANHALGILGVVFPIIGAIKANNGEVWRYPMAIPFFS